MAAQPLYTGSRLTGDYLRRCMRITGTRWLFSMADRPWYTGSRQIGNYY
jgi:hypothetical protein